jgi:uncharacterized protein (UPF0335 family)
MAKIGTEDGEPAGVGHNKPPKHDGETVLNGSAQGQLRSVIERIERLNQEKAEIAEQIKEVKAEAKGNGFDVPIIVMLIRKRAMDRAKGLERAAILDLYACAIGEPDLAELC